jgi:phosphoserine phosphatase RsbU/P
MVNPLTLSSVILDSLNEGVYVCDKDRRIVYWSKSAELITGWNTDEVVGHQCLENILCHIDKDGHLLCGEEFCPLHRAMVTGESSRIPIIVFAKAKDGHRIPTQVSVAPIKDVNGEIIGGVETFLESSELLADLTRAQKIQTHSLEYEFPKDPRICFKTFYLPHDFVGGDFFAIKQLDQSRYGFLLADVTGHGMAAALYTMHLSSLWNRYCQQLFNVEEFATTMNNELVKIVKDASFAAAVCGLIDVDQRELQLIPAGGPPILVFRSNGFQEELSLSSLPFGIMNNITFQTLTTHFKRGDRLLAFTDGAYEIHNSEGEELEVMGLSRILRNMDYPQKDIDIQTLEKELLSYSNSVRLEDDLTMIDMTFL